MAKQRAPRNIFLVGAGISINHPSCIPAAWPIMDVFCQWLSDGEQDIYQQLMHRCSPQHGENPFDFIRFESLIQAVTRIQPEVIQVLKILETYGYPNPYHLSLMDRARQGDLVITTNFDTRLETAAEYLDSPAQVFRLSTKNKRPKANTQLLKLHGSFPYRHNANSRPRATLNQIGNIGLGFEHFPGFREWFGEQTQNANVFVMGYSASDSFDVVPLLEQHCRAKRLVWFNYQSDATTASYQRWENSCSTAVPTRQHADDFVAMTLDALQHQQPQTEIYRFTANSLDCLFEQEFASLFEHHQKLSQQVMQDVDSSTYVQANLDALQQALDEQQLTRHRKLHICQTLLEDDSFGEHMVKPLDESEEVERSDIFSHTVALAQQGDFSAAEQALADYKNSAEFDEAEYLRSQCLINLEQGNNETAFAQVDAWHRVAFPDDDEISLELQLMYAESEFDHYLEAADLKGMRKARSKVRKLARKSGSLWGLLLWHSQLVQEDEFRRLKQKRPAGELTWQQNIQQHARINAYFALRTGRSYWFLPAVRRYAGLLLNFEQAEQAYQELLALLDWIPEHDIEEHGVSMAGLVSTALFAGDLQNAWNIIERMQQLSLEAWPAKSIFIDLAEAEIHAAEKDFEKALVLIDQAAISLQQIEPSDPWGCMDTIEYLRAEIQRNRKH